jgi:7-cyano-7-deazaguanine synthase
LGLRSVVLLSGGLDSVVNLKRAHDEGEVVLALTFDYGQTSFPSERRAAAECARRYGIEHRVIDLPWYSDLLPPVMSGRESAHSHDEASLKRHQDLLKEVWVPNRNCVLVAVGAAHAEAAGAGFLVAGFNLEEAEVFPDNSADFVEAMNRVLGMSTLSGVRVIAYTQGMTKSETVRLAGEIEAPLGLVYSCYMPSPEQVMCGSCQSCVRLKAALEANGLLERYAKRFQK